jgi:hypothetical protein
VAIEEKDLHRYVAAGIVRQVVVRKAGEGWELVFHLDNQQLVLERQRGRPLVVTLTRSARRVDRATGVTEFVAQIGKGKK